MKPVSFAERAYGTKASVLTPELLHNRYAPKIRRHIAAVMGAGDGLDDLVHEVLMRMFRSIGSVRDPACLDGWVAQVTANAIKYAIRRRRSRRYESWEELPERQVPSFQTDLDGRALAHRALQIIDQLPHRERALLTHYWFSPTTLERIAAQTGCSTSTMRRRLHKARARFEKLVRRDPALVSLVGGVRPLARRFGHSGFQPADHSA